MNLKFVIFSVFLLVQTQLHNAFGRELSVQERFRVLIQKCGKEAGATEDEKDVAFDSTLVPLTRGEKCLLTCTYRELNIITGDGQVVPGGFQRLGELLYRNTPSFNAAQEVAQVCSRVTVHPREGKCEIGAALRTCIAKINRAHGVKL